jgi:hypothetical protein
VIKPKGISRKGAMNAKKNFASFASLREIGFDG